MKIKELLEDVSTGGTGAGSMAPVEVPLGAVITRGAPTTKKSKFNFCTYWKSMADYKTVTHQVHLIC